MTVDSNTFLDALKSSSPSDRAGAAAWLLDHPEEISVSDLMSALQAESVARVRQLLLRVSEAQQAPNYVNATTRESYGSSVEADAGSASELRQERETAALVRHELSPAIGWIRLAADDEISNFGESRTNAAILRLQKRIDALVAVLRSSEPVHLTKIPLQSLIRSSWPPVYALPELVASDGQADIEIETDEELFSFILMNVFENAADASLEAVGDVQVRVTWGRTDERFWVRVTNPFRGERLMLRDVVGLGISSKPGNRGRGLAEIRLVAERLGMSWDLSGTSGVASFVVSGARVYA